MFCQVLSSSLAVHSWFNRTNTEESALFAQVNTKTQTFTIRAVKNWAKAGAMEAALKAILEQAESTICWITHRVWALHYHWGIFDCNHTNKQNIFCESIIDSITPICGTWRYNGGNFLLWVCNILIHSYKLEALWDSPHHWGIVFESMIDLITPICRTKRLNENEPAGRVKLRCEFRVPVSNHYARLSTAEPLLLLLTTGSSFPWWSSQ